MEQERKKREKKGVLKKLLLILTVVLLAASFSLAPKLIRYGTLKILNSLEEETKPFNPESEVRTETETELEV